MSCLPGFSRSGPTLPGRSSLMAEAEPESADKRRTARLLYGQREGGGPEEAAENRAMLDSIGHIHKGEDDQFKEYMGSLGRLVTAAVMPGGAFLLRDLDHTKGARADHPSSFKHKGRIIDPSSSLAREMQSRALAQDVRDKNRRSSLQRRAATATAAKDVNRNKRRPGDDRGGGFTGRGPTKAEKDREQERISRH